MRVNRRATVLLAGFATFASLLFGQSSATLGSQTRVKLHVGDKAPALKFSAWAKGPPVKKFEKGKVYVLDFWATWCGPCKASIPHLSKLSREYAGRVTFLGVDVRWGKESPEKVKRFLTENKGGIEYSVPIDSEDNYMSEHWMMASGQQGIPTVFVVGRDGRIGWIGDPSDLDRILAGAVKGHFDVSANRSELDKSASANVQQSEKMGAWENLVAPVEAAMKQGDYRQALTLLNGIGPSTATRLGMARSFRNIKLRILIQVDEERAYELASEMRAEVSDPYLLVVVGEVIDRKEGLSEKTLRLGRACLEQFLLAHPASSGPIEILADIDYRLGDFAKAVETEQKGIDLLMKSGEYLPVSLKEKKDRLAKYRSALEHRQTA
jgi:thiol-disulfide isomerase/thioredoxin